MFLTHESVFPAHAGVIPGYLTNNQNIAGFSRTRGGDPAMMFDGKPLTEFFPHTRGLSHYSITDMREHSVFPAHAGVILVEG